MPDLAEIELKRRIEWRCRRGLLELDELLHGFLQHGYAELSDKERACFARLLECSDPTLISWLLNNQLPDETELRHLVELITSR